VSGEGTGLWVRKVTAIRRLKSGQITLPREVARRLGVANGGYVKIIASGRNRIIIAPVTITPISRSRIGGEEE